MKIQLVDLHAQYLSIKGEIDEALQRVLTNSSYIGGNEVRSFEEDFASFCRVEHCVGVANGTDAISLALRSLGIGIGDEVITVAHTFIATAEAISSVGATPVFVDVCEDTLLMNPDLLEAAITERTRAIIPVHLYGQTCRMDEILVVAKKYGLKVIEDAAQAHGATWRDKPAGSFGDLATFSFYPGKNLGAYGDGGAVVGSDPKLIKHVRMIANHGRQEKYTHQIVGVNSRLDGLQAAVLRVKLKHLTEWNALRRKHAELYITLLKDSNLRLPGVHPNANPVWHLFVVRFSSREKIREQLSSFEIEAGVHYPVPLHQQAAYEFLNVRPGALPVTEAAATQVLSLPLYPEITEQMIKFVAEKCND
jgi:dTDP-4-amino-4,6-dideoxygalactose transaminase